MSGQVVSLARPVKVHPYIFSTSLEHEEPEESDQLDLPSEAELRSLFAHSFAAVTAAECQLEQELERYRALLSPLISEAENRISKDDGSHFLHRQMFADTFAAKEALATCLRHMDFAVRAAVVLRNALETKSV